MPSTSLTERQEMIWASSLSPSSKLILIYLAHQMGDRDAVQVSQGAIGFATSLDLSTVIRKIGELNKAGILQTERKTSVGKIRTNEYAIASALKELEKYGYFTRQKLQDATERFVWKTAVFDSPQQLSGNES